MKMPLSEIIDRYTITQLKSERTNEDVSDELEAYSQEIDKYKTLEHPEKIDVFVRRLYEVNGQMWDKEGDIRSGVDLPLEEVGRLALECRDINCLRNGVKAEIVDEFAEGFKEIKVNYQKVNYGRSE
jgi:hypothetical protein